MMLQCNEIAHKTNWQKNAAKTKKQREKQREVKENQVNPAQKGFNSNELKREVGKLC